MLRGWDLSFWQGEVPYNFRRLNTWMPQVNATPDPPQHAEAHWVPPADHARDHPEPDHLTIRSGNMEIDD